MAIALATSAIVPATVVGPAPTAHAAPANWVSNERWMADMAPTIGARPLNQVVLPGSHDSGTYDMDAYHAAQDLTVYDQLVHGVRQLDLRAYWEKNVNDYLIFHGSVGKWASDIPIGTALGDISRFTQMPGHEREIVLVNVLWTTDGDPNLQRLGAVCSAFLQSSGSLVARQSMLPPNTSIYQMTPNEIGKLPGSPRIILSWLAGSSDASPCSGSDINNPYAFGGYYANQCVGGTITAAIAPALAGRFVVGTEGNPNALGPTEGGFYNLSLAGTAAFPDCPWRIDTLASHEPYVLDQVKGWYDNNLNNARKNLNILSIDFVETTNLLQDVMAMNAGPVLDPGVSVGSVQAGAPLSPTCRGQGPVGVTSAYPPAKLEIGGQPGLTVIGNLSPPDGPDYQISSSSGTTVFDDGTHRQTVTCTDSSGRTSRVTIPIFQPLSSAVADIYTVSPDGTLNCSQHTGYLAGANLWQNSGLTVGSGWNTFKQVFSAAGAIYAIQNDGALLWYQHNGAATCAAQPWSGANTVGSGWQNFKQVIPMTTSTGSGAVMYAIQNDGTLQWYKHLGAADGSNTWAGPKTVGTGWQNFKQVFSSGDGVIYAIQNDGTLQWYKHLGVADGSNTWAGPKTVGTGWQNFKLVFSSAGGIIYALQNDGTLQWSKHLGVADGGNTWAGPKTVGTWWQNTVGAFLRSPAAATS